jgi:hypothetical protein
VSAAERQLRADRALRDAAKLRFDTHLAILQADLEERGLAGRIVDEVSEVAGAMAEEAIEVVEDHPGVVGGTIGALALWLLRNPILAWLEHLLGHRPDNREEPDA